MNDKQKIIDEIGVIIDKKVQAIKNSQFEDAYLFKKKEEELIRQYKQYDSAEDVFNGFSEYVDIKIYGESIPEKFKEINNKIEDVKNEKIQAVKNQEFELAASKRDREKQMLAQLTEEVNKWEYSLFKSSVPKANRFVFRINSAGIIEVLLEHENGTVIFSDGKTLLENNLYIFTYSKWTSIIKRLENLINTPNVKEQDLQDFFEEYPELILEEDFEEIIPQATIVTTEGVKWKADFILKPKNQLDFCKILELKLPKENIFNKKISSHSKYSAKLMRGIHQLKDYHEAFTNPQTCDLFQNKYSTNIFKPDLHLLIGRRPSSSQYNDYKEVQRRYNVKIEDWDSLVDKLKRKFK